MKKILFVCTANIYRSRFAEEVFNSLAINRGASLRAFSAGLKVGEYTTRKIYYPALEQLERYNITPQRENELSTHIDDCFCCGAGKFYEDKVVALWKEFSFGQWICA